MPLWYLLRKLAHKNATGGGGNLSPTHKHTHVTVFHTPPQITTHRSAMAAQGSPVTTYPHGHATASWKTFHLPTPKPTHATTDGDLAYRQKRTSMCTRCWGPSHGTASKYRAKATPSRKPPYQAQGDSLETTPQPLHRKHEHT